MGTYIIKNILVYHKLLSLYFFLILQLGYSLNLIMYIGRLYYFIHLNNIHWAPTNVLITILSTLDTSENKINILTNKTIISRIFSLLKEKLQEGKVGWECWEGGVYDAKLNRIVGAPCWEGKAEQSHKVRQSSIKRAKALR